MKKRIASILLAVMMIVTLLPLGLVDTAWAAETQDAQRKAVTERAQAYIAACNSFSAQNGQSIPYWTISDAEFEGYVQTKTRDKAAETSKLKKQVDAGDFMSALTTKTCTGSNGSHQWSNEKYTCRSHYFSGLDNRGGGYSQCQGFANYMAYVLFGEAGTSESNFTKMTQVGYGFDFQPGDVLRVLDSNGKNGHSMVVYEGSGSSAKVIECNWGHSSRGYCNVRWDLTVAQKQKQFPTVETVWRPNASLAITSGGTDSGGGTTEDVIDSGNCGANGANVTWKLTSDGTLTISGTGKMADYGWEETPWYGLRLQVKTIIIKDGVTNIGDYAFDNCTKLTRAEIPDSVTNIGAYAFHMCDALKTLTIPKSVTWIAEGAFSVSNISINVAAENRNYCIEDGVLYDKEKTTLIYVGSLAKEFFTIPGSVTRIALWAFFGCTSLTNITIPKSVTCISRKAFYCCDSLANVYYDGTEADWAKIVIAEGNEDLTNAKLHAATIFTPANVELVGATPAANSITVTWKAAEGASAYVIYRKPAGTNSWAIIARNVSGTSYTDKSVTAGESYTYTVRGVAADGRTMSKGYDTKGVTAKVPTAVSVPANVTMKNAAVSGSSIVVTWQAAEGASTYTIYRKPTGTNNWAIIARNVSGTSYTDKSVTAGESYTYTVRGVAADGKTMSKGYDTKGVTAKAPAASGVPVNVTLTAAKADSAGILVTWEAAANAQTYTVYRKLTGTNSWAIVVRSVAGTAWKDIHADKGISYTYTVRGVAADGRTMSKGYDTKGVTDQVTKAITTPANVTMTAASSSGTGIAVTWEYALDAKTYVVYRKPTGTNNWAIIARNVSGTSYTDKSVTAGESYTYTVRGVAADGRTMSKGYDAKGVTAKAFAVAASSVTG